MKILFIAAGSPATVFALTPLATAARNAGHQVFMAASENMTPFIARAGLPAISASALSLDHFMFMDRSGNPVSLPTDPMQSGLFTGRWFGRMAAAYLDSLLTIAEDWRPDVVVGGMMSYSAPLLAAHLGIPHVRQAWDAIGASGFDPGADEELQPELKLLGLDRIPESDLFVDVCPPSLRPSGAPPAQMMRPIPGNEQRPLQPWMYARDGRRRICVTMGSRVALNQREYPANAFGALVDMVASIGPLHAETVVAAPDEVASELCARFDGVRAGWVPLDVVAPTCDALVHHAGGVTTLTGMSAGVPQLLLPRGDALADAARRLERYGAAIVLPPSENKGANILKACEKLIDEPIHRERAQAIAHEIAAMPSPADVVGVIESLAAGSRS